MVDDPGPLHLLASYPEAHHIVPLLIDLGADMERRDEEGNTSLHRFVKANMLQVHTYVQAIIIISGERPYPLSHIHHHDTYHTQGVAVLLSRGANVHATNQQLDTPLHLAARMEHEDMMTLLLSYGADEYAKVGR